ncbi:MAG: bifunctional (p)ppGpp synthetase/guanosine-3',5'-bis(diphosphate) 3'-pyrophosphohydrolase [Clostridiales bacterium]|nr:bifunctional (p)ppGpp synthetase/guanosine-3',5'-bis(diphosphate) 3'-pyrophosphohydrolase [Clostridiales bacterium]
MISLNDYLYNGDTVAKILHVYSQDLKESAIKNDNSVDLAHSNCLIQMSELLEHNEFLTLQSQKLREFYKYMTEKYPFLAFTFKGRIKSLIRLEEKINGNIVEYIYDYHCRTGSFPSETDIKEQIRRIKDMIAYRIVISLPKCHLKPSDDREELERKYIYEIANALPGFLEERGFEPEVSGLDGQSDNIDEQYRKYYRDYISVPKAYDYRSLHIAFFDITSRSNIEVQIRTKTMDDNAEIGPANHLGYEKRQEHDRARREAIPVGENIYFDNAFERGMILQKLDLSKVDVNMFGAVNNSLVNDGCGLYRGRLILPYEHLSRFQNDLV